MDEPIRLERQGHVALLTLNRPETLNALSGDDLFAAFETLFAELNADTSVRAAILTGAGRAFCAGGNIADMRDRAGMFAGSPDELVDNYRHGIQRIPRAFEALRVPIIAAINGPAIGAGLDLACFCDIRIASTKASFAESFVKVGIVPGDGGAWILPRIVGPGIAAELLFTGDTINADRALAIGLVNSIVEPGALADQAQAMGERIGRNPPQTLRWAKQLMMSGRHTTLDTALDEAGPLQGRAHHTQDHREAVAAFFEKRAPHFTGV